MEQVEVDGLRIAYQRAGTGLPLILLHGYVGDGPTLWRRQLEEFCDDFTVVAWDAPGTGGSSDPPESFGMAGYADCLAGFIKRLGLERRTWPGCRSVARLPWSSTADIPPCRPR
jgi:pimeloyl-ACP methyl ester carboxylesterase